jgi:hypothetical protein
MEVKEISNEKYSIIISKLKDMNMKIDGSEIIYLNDLKIGIGPEEYYGRFPEHIPDDWDGISKLDYKCDYITFKRLKEIYPIWYREERLKKILK